MYYRKYFSGSIESNTAYRTIKNISTNANINDYYNQTDIMCFAVRSTLEDVGIQCEYDETTRILKIEETSIQIVVYHQSGYIEYHANGIKLAQLQSSIPFSGVNYKFYVTLKGDKDGILHIFIGTFTAPATELYGFLIGKGTDLRDGQDIRIILGGNIDLATEFYIFKNDAILTDYKNRIAFGQRLSTVNDLSNNGKEITLVECVAQPGRFKLNNCYFGSTSLTVREFYNIGGDIYYCMSNNILIKCVNEQSS